MKDKINQEHHTAIVFGGVSGLGLEVVKRLAREGLHVVGVGRNPKKLLEASQEVAGAGLSAQFSLYDASNTDDLERLKTYLIATNRQVKYVVSTCGSLNFKSLEDSTDADIDHIMASNFLPTVKIARAFIEQLRLNHGAFAAVVTRAALSAAPSEIIYSGAKWGMRGFLASLRERERGRVKIMSVFPGGMGSCAWDAWPEVRASLDTGDFLDPSEVADTIATAMLADSRLEVSELVISRIRGIAAAA